jgi:hypothetical protein
VDREANPEPPCLIASRVYPHVPPFEDVPLIIIEQITPVPTLDLLIRLVTVVASQIPQVSIIFIAHALSSRALPADR